MRSLTSLYCCKLIRYWFVAVVLSSVGGLWRRPDRGSCSFEEPGLGALWLPLTTAGGC